MQASAGIALPPSNDFSLYDHVLDTACLVGAVPASYGWDGGPVSLETRFSLARGTSTSPALEMTKWFDTNYHYLVSRIGAGQVFALTENTPLLRWNEARAMGIETRPVLLGPVSFLRLSRGDHIDPLSLLDQLLPVYEQVLAELSAAGVAQVQIDEPVLCLDLDDADRKALTRAYERLQAAGPPLVLASYFGPLGENLATALRLPVAGLHLDLVRGASDLDAVLEAVPQDMILSLGVVDGRNVWRNDLAASLALLRRVGERHAPGLLQVAPSCSLLHVPVDLEAETALDPHLRSWLAFARQKLDEVALLSLGACEGDEAIAGALARNQASIRVRRDSGQVHDAAVAARLGSISDFDSRRRTPFGERRVAQQARLPLASFPTTTIGSFPQTQDVRAARAAHARGTLDQASYDALIAGWIDDVIRRQEEIGLDVFVHGEFERNDMVKYFGEQLAGYAFTRHGWVQSYGSRCVSPPIIWGDVSRPAPMTVRWTTHAQSRTSRPMKGMLTGPVTMMQWSFVRDDLPRETVCRQIALALRDEVADLERSGIAIIQVAEPAFREGLPLRRHAQQRYLEWAVGCFRLATSTVADATRIHTHMCYSEFNDIMPSIAAMDADAISIETTRSRMGLLDAFAVDGVGYPAEIGPGIWDIHSPRVPDADEMLGLLRLARQRLGDWQIWVNPDCGLKTRSWAEVEPALRNLVAAAARLRLEA